MHPTIVILVVALTPRQLGPHTPHITRLARAGVVRPLATITPAITCPVQATFMTGVLPRDHGIVANGWLFRDLLEVWLWRQSNRTRRWRENLGGWQTPKPGLHRGQSFLVVQHRSEPRLRRYASTHLQGGRAKIPDCYTQPAELRNELTAELGTFPLFNFWGPGTSIASSRWIANAALMFDARTTRFSLSSTFRTSTMTCSVTGRQTPAAGRILRMSMR